MTEHRSIDSSTEKLFETVLQKIEEQFDIKRKESSAGVKLLSRFDELKKYNNLFVHKVTELKGDAGAFTILLLEKHLTITEQKRHARVEKVIEEIEPVLLFNLSHDVGKAFIRPETISDKVLDLFNKIDIDFAEYPTFSKNYYVVGQNAILIRKYLPKALLECLDKIQGMTIEIDGDLGLLRSEKNLTENLLLLLISIGYKLTK